MIPAIASVNQSDLATQQLKFKQQLENVVAQIAITSDFTISYEDLEPLAVSSRLKEYLNQITPQDLNRYLAAKLQRYIYNIFTTKVSLKSQNSLLKEAIKENNSESLPKTDYVNKVNKWSKTKFYQELTQNNHGQGYEDPGWLVVKQVNDHWHVTKNDLTLQIQPKHLVEPSAELSPGKLISLKMPPSLVERGIYIAVGEVGSPGSSNEVSLGEDFTMNQLYFNVGTGGALCLLDSLTRKLNQVRVPFDFRINYNETEFDRLDVVVLEFKSSDYDLIYSIVQTTYQDHQAYFRPEIPFFCKFLAPGLGFAEKPQLRSPKRLAPKGLGAPLRPPGGASMGVAQSPIKTQENIGQYYCGIIALALVELWQQESLIKNNLNNQPNNKLNYVLNYLSAKNVDIEHLYLNSNCNHAS
ncbi:MAG: T3SS effector HopA1 family protein [Waterburya sp.]